MTSHLQGCASRGPGRIARCLSSLTSFSSSSSTSNSCSRSSSSSNDDRDAIELHEWKPASAPSGQTNSSTAAAADEQQQAAVNEPTKDPAAVNHRGNQLLHWLQRKSVGVWWGPVVLLLLLLLLSPTYPAAAAAEAPPSAPLQQPPPQPLFEAEGAPNEASVELQRGAPHLGAPEVQQGPPQPVQEAPEGQGGPLEEPFDMGGAPFRRLSSLSAWSADFEASLRLSPRLCLYLGVFLTLFGSLLMAGGSTLMKLGLSVEDTDSLRGQTCDQQWLWGFAAYVAGACMHVVALGFAPASVLSPMNSIGLIANAVASATVLKEPFGFQELLFTGGCALGVFLCACASVLPRTAAGALGGPLGGPSALGGGWEGWEGGGPLASWRDPWYLGFLGACCGLGFGALVYLNSVESALLEEREQQLLTHADRDLAVLQHPGSPAQEHSPKEMMRAEPMLSPRSQTKQTIYPRLVGLCYGFLAGLVGSQCILEVKEIGTCARFGLTDPSIWFSPQPYLVCCFLGLSVWMQIHFLNLGLARGDATTIVPTYYVVWTFFGTLGGFAKFHEVQGFSVGALVLFGLGFGLTAICIILLAVQEMRNLRKYVDQQVPEIDDEEADLQLYTPTHPTSSRLTNLPTTSPLSPPK
ncbi:hypothetical protein, conserved [Eimeria brunetti]|uniref:DUF803 domain-containing protein n=1 Tax=Eimeria brunetti TaxID=51314 RepID=U6LHX2_9EIME|nr:hypothetical protein, conserved [Eimeria brunetti]